MIPCWPVGVRRADAAPARTAGLTVDEHETPDRDRPLRSFGRRRGRRLTARQSALLESGLASYRLDLASPPPSRLQSLFDTPVDDVWLEIGFGDGEHLLWQALANPGVGFIGCEPYVDGVIKVLDGIGQHGLGNIRVHDDDARDVLDWCPPATLSRVFILFPDPWPKKRHIKRRIVSTALLDVLSNKMAHGAELRLATDIPDYARAMMIALHHHEAFEWLADRADHWRRRPADWPQTKYERKALREGRCGYFLRFKRK